MKKAILLISVLSLLSIFQLFSVNHMDLMFYMQGNQAYDMFGQGLAALDFNGDGYDDLVVLENAWVPDSLFTSPPTAWYGRLLFYYGGPDFDSTPDFTINGTYNGHLTQLTNTGYLIDLGDVNGDGCDDLGVRGFTPGNVYTRRFYIAVYFGCQNPSTQPGFYKAFLSPNPDGYAEIEALGDVNGDGYDDFGYCYHPDPFYDNEFCLLGFVLGGSMNEVSWRQFNAEINTNISDAGDVNADGYDDFLLTVVPSTPNSTKTTTLFFGCTSMVPVDSVVVNIYNGVMYLRGADLGDINNDGYDDFTGLITGSTYVWLGNSSITNNYDLQLSPINGGTGVLDRGLVHGDFNADGFEDIFGSSPEGYGESGVIRLWLGRATMNGTCDLTIIGNFPGMLLGTGMAAGDFNADGYFDIAASAPHSSNFDSTPGRVYVYAGNDQLADTTTGVEDIVVAPSNNWSFRIIPNPLPEGQSLKLRFTGTGYERLRELRANIYNIKGQKVGTYLLDKKQIASGEAMLPGLALPSGVYEVAIFSTNLRLKANRVTIR